MAHPKRRTSKSVKRMRRSHLALKPVSVVACPQCGQNKRPHTVCASCGFYDKNRPVFVQTDEE